MNKTAIFFILLSCWAQAQAQQPVDSLSALYAPYRGAMGMLYQSQPALPQDSTAFAREWQRLNTELKHVSDSVTVVNTTEAATYFELRRHVDLITFNTKPDSLPPRLNRLYGYTAAHQNAILENSIQFNKVAQCLMGIRNDSLRNDLKIAAFSAQFVQALYRQLDTKDWDNTDKHYFFSFFAGQYANMGNMRMAEKIYRQFDALLVQEQPAPKRMHFTLPNDLQFRNGVMHYTSIRWKDLKKGKIIIHVQQQDLFNMVYLITTLRAFDVAYRNNYDVVIVRDRNIVTDEYLRAVKRNLAFDEYYIATIDSALMASLGKMPAVLLLNAYDEVGFQTNNITTLFKNLNAPLEAQHNQSELRRLAALAQKKEALKQRTIQAKDNISYQTEHKNITFVLKGNWEENLSTQLTPMRWSETDTIVDTTKPYLAQFEVKHPQYQVYQLMVLVNGKQQEISITSNWLNQKELSCSQNEQAGFHEARQNIDSTLMLESNYNSIIANYPFQASPFIKNLKQKQEELMAYKQDIFISIKKPKQRSLLEKYAEKKKELIR